MHQANAAEWAIQTFKAHLKAGITSLDPDFSVREWDRLIPQAELTLNLLREFRNNPRSSAYAYMFGQSDYNRTPLVPLRTKALAHLKPTVRSTCSSNGEEGWTVGSSMEHYRCIEYYFPSTQSQQHVDTVTFFPKHITFPKISIDEFLRQATMNIVTILTATPSNIALSLQASDPVCNALLGIATLLNRTDRLPILTPSANKKLVPRVATDSAIKDTTLLQK